MEHGGYGAVFQITELALNQTIMVLHRGGQLPEKIVSQFSIPDPEGSGEVTIAVDLWMDAPEVLLSAANGGYARVDVRLFGTTTISNSQSADGTRNIRINLKVNTLVEGSIDDIPPEAVFNTSPAPGESPISIVPRQYELSASFTPVSVVGTNVFVASGDPLPQSWLAFFQTAAFRTGLGFELANNLANIQTILPRDVAPILRLFSIGQGVVTSLESGIGNQYLSIGINLSATLPSFSTTGSMPAVTHFLGSGDIAIVVNESITALLAEQLRNDMQQAVSPATIESLSISFHSNFMRISGHADHWAGSADFQFDATPKIGRPGWKEIFDDEYGQFSIWHEPTDEIWLDISNLTIDEGFSFITLLSIAGGLMLVGSLYTPYAASQFFISLINELMVGIRIKIVSQAQDPILSAHQELSLGSGAQPPFDITLYSLKVFSDRVRSKAYFKPQHSGHASISGPSSIDIYEALNSENRYRFDLKDGPFDYHPDDPEIRVRWQIRRANSDYVYATYERDQSDLHPFYIRVKFSDFDFGTEGITAIIISARVYRTGAQSIADLNNNIWTGASYDYLNTSRAVAIVDKINRFYPYCQWSHKVITPDVIVHSDGTHETIGKRIFKRDSVIHRTDLPGRCKFVSQFTDDITTPEYLDELPFDLEQIDEHREEICDFCFYGGPQSKSLKI